MAQVEGPTTISMALVTSLNGHDADPHLGMSAEDQGHFAEAIGAPGLNQPIELATADLTPSNPGYHIEETRTFMAEQARARAASAPAVGTANS